MTSVADLVQVVDDLAAVDLDTLDDETLHQLTVAVMRERDRLAGVHARLLARWDMRRLWRSDRSRSAASRLAREACCFVRTARHELRRARRLATMPVTATALLQGRVSIDQVDVLTRANLPHRQSHMASDEQQLVDACTALSAGESQKLLTYWGHRVDAIVGRDTGRPDVANHVHVSTTLDGNVVIDGQLDPVGGAAFADELRRLTEQIRLADEASGIDRTPAQRRAAALVNMASRSASMPPDARRPRPLFSVQLGDDSFRHLCELANGTVVTPRDLVPWLTTADLETVLFDGPATVISVSHRRSFTGALRRAIEVRDRHCQHPAGCDLSADQCDVDHIVPHSAGGLTDQFNGRLQCPTHNRRADFHDHGAQAPPRRTITHMDALRARVRWRVRHGI